MGEESKKSGFSVINEELKKYNLILPPYGITNGLLGEIGKDLQEGKDIQSHATKHLVLNWRRAYQMVYRYRELNIFKPVINIIEFATLSFMKNNFVCAYISLFPVIEKLLREWAKEEGDEGFYSNPKKYIKRKLEELQDQFPKGDIYKDWLNEYIDFFDYILHDVLYENSKNVEKGNIFNRNIVLHNLEEINNRNCLRNTTRLFLVIDIIAELYLRSNWDKYPKLQGVFDLEFNQPLFDLYFKYYNSASYFGLYHSHENIINNTLCKKDLTN